MTDTPSDKPPLTPEVAAHGSNAPSNAQFVQTGRSGDGTTISRDMGASNSRRAPDSSYQNYLFGGAGSEEHPAWSDSAKGRFAIRLLSRGIVGAAFFTVGGRMAQNQLKGYNQATWKWKNINSTNWLQAVAKGFDITLGRAIEGAVRGIASLKYTSDEARRIGKEAVTFRNSRVFEGSGFDKGRSYGSDVVHFTFDFAMASIGDALTRNIVQAFDPNIKQTWKVNDKGELASKGEHWHFVPSEFLKWSGKTAWRILSKNQGEDWAAAIPYAFQMKFQRQFLSNIFGKRWSGHDVVFDHGWNGGAYKVSNGKIVGDYQLVGAIDLHARFVGYNWYTLMFREGYDAIGNAWRKWKENGFVIQPHWPEHLNPITSTMDGVGRTMRYVTKSFIKANLYMNPAVIPFWMFRVPQSKWRGEHFIENGKLGVISGAPGGYNAMNGQKPYEGSIFGSKAHYEHIPTRTNFDKFEEGFSRFLHPLGKLSNWAGIKMGAVGNKVAGTGLLPKSVNTLLGDQKFMHNFVDASFSYTPYMWAKAETALRVDDNKGDGKLGQMDKAIYRLMDNGASLNLKGIKKSLGEIWTLGTNFERNVVSREGDNATQVASNSKPASAPVPGTTVHVDSVVHANNVQATNDGRYGRRASDRPPAEQQPAANDPNYQPQNDRQWAQMVAGSDIHPSRIHSASQTRH